MNDKPTIKRVDLMRESDIIGHTGNYDAFKVVYTESFKGGWVLDTGKITPVKKPICKNWNLKDGYCKLSIYNDNCDNKNQKKGVCLYDVIVR